jgi:hypothetical protein
MIRIGPRTIIFTGFILVFLGFLLPLLMVLKVLESTFFLNIFSFVASMLGVTFGLIGTAQFVIEVRNSRDRDK